MRVARIDYIIGDKRQGKHSRNAYQLGGKEIGEAAFKAAAVGLFHPLLPPII